MPSEDRPPLPTAPRDHDRRQQARSWRWRQAFMAGLLLFFVLALANVFGLRTRTTTVHGGGYVMDVLYPQVTRPGISSPLAFTVRREDGGPLPGELTFETSSAYLDLFDDQAIEPNPSEIRADGHHILWIVQPEQDAHELRVYLDARIDPGKQWGASGVTTLYADGEAVATAEYHTWVLP